MTTDDDNALAKAITDLHAEEFYVTRSMLESRAVLFSKQCCKPCEPSDFAMNYYVSHLGWLGFGLDVPTGDSPESNHLAKVAVLYGKAVAFKDAAVLRNVFGLLLDVALLYAYAAEKEPK